MPIWLMDNVEESMRLFIFLFVPHCYVFFVCLFLIGGFLEALKHPK